MRQLVRGPSIMKTWFGSAPLFQGAPAPDVVPTMSPPAFVQHPSIRSAWMTMVRKPEHAPEGSTVTLYRHRN